MGIVLKARDESIERDVPVKVLIGNMAQDTVAMGRFLAEAKAAGKINHPNVVTVYEISNDGPTQFIAIELVSGGSTSEELEKKEPYSAAQATRRDGSGSRCVCRRGSTSDGQTRDGYAVVIAAENQ